MKPHQTKALRELRDEGYRVSIRAPHEAGGFDDDIPRIGSATPNSPWYMDAIITFSGASKKTLVNLSNRCTPGAISHTSISITDPHTGCTASAKWTHTELAVDTPLVLDDSTLATFTPDKEAFIRAFIALEAN